MRQLVRERTVLGKIEEAIGQKTNNDTGCVQGAAVGALRAWCGFESVG
jgi:hypothetical protein